jgi:propanol-preferring alcohol dehydrogenase
MSPKLVVFKAARILGSAAGTRAQLAEAYKMVAYGQVTPIVEVIPFATVNDGWDRLKTGKFEARLVMSVDPALMDVRGSLAAEAGKI